MCAVGIQCLSVSTDHTPHFEEYFLPHSGCRAAASQLGFTVRAEWRPVLESLHERAQARVCVCVCVCVLACVRVAHTTLRSLLPSFVLSPWGY